MVITRPRLPGAPVVGGYSVVYFHYYYSILDTPVLRSGSVRLEEKGSKEVKRLLPRRMHPAKLQMGQRVHILARMALPSSAVLARFSLFSSISRRTAPNVGTSSTPASRTEAGNRQPCEQKDPCTALYPPADSSSSHAPPRFSIDDACGCRAGSRNIAHSLAHSLSPSDICCTLIAQ